MVNLKIYASLLYSLRRQNSVGLQDCKKNAPLKNLKYSATMNYFAGFTHEMYFSSRPRMRQGRKILPLSY